MKMKIVLLLAVVLFFQSPSPVYAETATIQQKVVGKTIKIVAKFVVATTNLKKAKKKIVNKLRLMEEEQFRTEYAELYEMIKDLPRDIKVTYNVTPAMTREQMIENIGPLNKKEIYKIISSIPDKMVAGLLKKYRKVI